MAVVDNSEILTEIANIRIVLERLVVSDERNARAIKEHNQKFAEITSTLPLEERFSLVSDTIKELADKFHELESRFYKGDYDKSLLKLLTLADDVQLLLHRTKNQSNKLLNLGDRIDVLEDSLAEIRQTVNRLTQQYVAPVNTLDELAIQAETDMVYSRLMQSTDLGVGLSKLYDCGIIDRTDARRILGFKK